MKGSMKGARLLVVLASLAHSTGCAGLGALTANSTADTFCGVVEEPVCIRDGDRLVESTASRIEGINLAHRRLCPAAAKTSCGQTAKPAPAATTKATTS